MTDTRQTLRIDKWLWYARFFKTRGLASKTVTGGHVRGNGNHASKASHGVAVGDTLTFPQARQIRVIRILALGTRRGPAPEAQALYEDLTPPSDPDLSQPHSRKGARPTKKDRRKLDAERSSPLE